MQNGVVGETTPFQGSRLIDRMRKDDLPILFVADALGGKSG